MGREHLPLDAIPSSAMDRPATSCGLSVFSDAEAAPRPSTRM